MMNEVYSPFPDALVRIAAHFATLEQERDILRTLKQTQPLTDAQQDRLCTIGSQLDAITERFEGSFEGRPWLLPDVSILIENLHHAAWWN